MFIYEQSSESRYFGSVDNLESLKYHGKGILSFRKGAKNPCLYKGEFQNGKREGFGVE